MTRPPEAASVGSATTLRLGELVGALTYALDLTEGQPEGHSLRVAVLGMTVADQLGYDAWQRSDLYYALLLKDLGCSSNAARLSATFGSDDLQVKHAFKLVDLGDVRQSVPFVLQNAGRKSGPLRRARHMLDVSLGLGGGQTELMRIRCERGADIARDLGFREPTYEAIRALDEHWDGGGHPYGLAGDEIPQAAQILLLAQTAEVFWAAHGADAARETIRERRGRWFAPDVVDAFLEVSATPESWDALARDDELVARVAALEPAELSLRADDAMLDRVAAAFARVIDAKSPWTYRHSERVRAFALGIADRVGLPEDRCRGLSRAALLHDVGKLGVPNTILDKPGRLTDDEFARIQRHAEDSERILERVDAFRSFARDAAAHHERLDGSGYHQGRSAEAISLEARILATADPFEALTADRPYRSGMTSDDALALLRADAGTALDADCVEALADFVASDEGQALVADGRRQPE